MSPMPIPPPALVALDHDGYRAEHVGRTADGRQFFLTTPFQPDDSRTGWAGAEYIALFLFDEAGALLEARIDDMGSRQTLDREHYEKKDLARLADLGNVDFGRIGFRPFALQEHGTVFGLVLRQTRDEDGVVQGWAVDLMPGDSMCFLAPWDSGEYDT